MSAAAAAAPAQLLEAAVAWTLIHSIWQGAVVALFSAIGRRISSSCSCRARIGTIALVVFVAAQAITFVVVLRGPDAVFATSSAAVESTLSDVRTDGFMRRIAVPQTFASEWIDRGLWLAPIVTAGWVIALAVLLMRAGVAMWIVRRLLRRSRPVAEGRRKRFTALSHALHIRRAISFAETDHSTVPIVTGIRTPTVLLPPLQVLRLSEPQVEALVLHELAHVRRHDVAAGIARAFVGCLYFFHPAIALVRRLIDHDVEEAADELAAGTLGDKTAYAGALLTLVERRQATTLILGAAGGSLRQRIVNVLRGPSEARRRNGSTLLGTAAALLVGLVVIGQMLGAAAKDRADMAWVEAHDIAGSVIATLTTDADNPAFDAALQQCIGEVRDGGSVRASSRAALTDAALVAAPSDRLYRLLCETGFEGRHPHFGAFGTVAEQNRLIELLLASATDDRSARAIAVVSAVCGLDDNTVLLRNVLRNPGLSRLMQLEPPQFYRIQLARSAYSKRSLRAIAGLQKIRSEAPSREEVEQVWRDLQRLPDIELGLASGVAETTWPALIAVDDRINAGQSLKLLRRLMADRRE